MNRDSGRQQGRRSIRVGTGGAGHGAMSARRHNPALKAFADRLQAAGKAVITAVARKLVVIANAVLQKQQRWQPQMA